ncbi:MAG: hypothetical protein MI725_10120 [Pirellulales bacterium]|nr:hypothetical protein [Pirellulales bacterium]
MGQTSSSIQVQLFGDYRICRKAGQDITPRSKKSRAIVAYLCLSSSGTETREKLRSLVWSSRGEKQARDSLRQTLATLKRDLRDSGGSEILHANRDKVSLLLDSVTIDAREVRTLATSENPGDWEKLPELCKGELLADLEVEDPAFNEWLLVERMRYQDLLRASLERLLEHHTTAANLRAAADTARRLLDVDCTHEEAHRVLMQSYAARGDNASAVRQYQILKTSLQRELDVTPSPETEHLYSDLKSRKPLDLSGQHRGFTPVSVGRGGTETPIAVLPFDNRSGQPADAPLCDGITQGIVTALTRFRSLLIVGQHATQVFLEQRADILEIGRKLQVDYLLDGSVLRSGQRIKVTVELIQCATARTIWADQYKGSVHDAVEVEDYIASRIAARLSPRILMAEISRAAHMPPDDTSPHLAVMRAIPLIYRMDRDAFGEADQLLKTAIDNDPMYGSAYAWRGFWQLINIGQQWADDVPVAIEEIEWLTRVATELDPEDAVAFALRGHVESFINHNFQQALACFERALALNPNLPYAWAFSAVTFCYLGDTTEALRRLERYRELAPFDPYPFYFDTAFCMAFAFCGEHEKAASVGRKILSSNPNYYASYRPLIASLGHLDQLDEARGLLKKLLENEPHFTIDWLRTKYPPLPEDMLENYIAGLRKAGVKEN